MVNRERTFRVLWQKRFGSGYISRAEVVIKVKPRSGHQLLRPPRDYTEHSYARVHSDDRSDLFPSSSHPNQARGLSARPLGTPLPKHQAPRDRLHYL